MLDSGGAKWQSLAMIERARITFARFPDILDPARALQDIEEIFFEAAGRKEFSSSEARDLFLERWLLRYLAADARLAHIAVTPENVVGYVVGSHDDPAHSERFADIPYFADLASVTKNFPAHLHINLREEARGKGIGAELVERFCRDARSAGLPGAHVVTGLGMRNVGFYTRTGFTECARATYLGRPVVMLGRKLQKQ